MPKQYRREARAAIVARQLVEHLTVAFKGDLVGEFDQCQRLVDLGVLVKRDGDARLVGAKHDARDSVLAAAAGVEADLNNVAGANLGRRQCDTVAAREFNERAAAKASLQCAED